MSLKKVEFILPAQMIDMGGFPVKQALPTQRIQQIDPFLLLHHARSRPLTDRPAKIQGVGPHPHRGFSPVTFVIEGEVHHRDSRGNSQIASAGDVQWMHAGAGIIHSERPSQKLVDERGPQEIIQLWINTPASKKMSIPEYQYLADENIPKLKSPDGKTISKIIAGDYEGVKSDTKTQSELLVMWVSMDKEGVADFIIPSGFSSCLYVINGKISVRGFGMVDKEEMAKFDIMGDKVNITAKEDGQFLLLAGKPIDEEIVQYGPYVMNTQTQILQAMRDYQMGKMGVLIED